MPEHLIFLEVLDMKLFRTKVWNVMDIGMLKWSATLFGMIVGSYLSSFVKRYVWIFGIAMLILAIRPTISYLKDDGVQ
jgi:putative Mn2+ efflux pump MntP